MIGQVIVGFIFAAIGFIFVWKTAWLLKNFGRIGFAEKHLGTEGGSRLMYKLGGTLLIIGGLLHALNLLNSLVKKLVTSIFSF